MEKGAIFQVTAPNGVELTAIVLNVTSTLDESSYNDRVRCCYICYAQNRIFEYFVSYKKVSVAVGRDEYGDDIMDDQTIIIDSSFGETLVGYCVIPIADEALEKYTTEQVTLNHRMILIESTLGLSVEQEVAICEAIGKIVSPEEKHLHVTFDRHFADKDLVEKYNLAYTIIDE